MTVRLMNLPLMKTNADAHSAERYKVCLCSDGAENVWAQPLCGLTAAFRGFHYVHHCLMVCLSGELWGK